MKNLAMTLGIGSFILGGLTWVVGSGPIRVILVILIALLVFTTIKQSKRLTEEGKKREGTIALVIANLGFLLAILANGVSMISKF